MTYNNFIDTIATFSKAGIENSNRTREDKEWRKLGADFLSAMLKQTQPLSQQYPHLAVMGIGIEQIPRIKDFACQFHVDKIVIFPCSVNNQVIPIVRIYGGDRQSFVEAMGWKVLGSNAMPEEKIDWNELENEYGIILYENNER